MAWWADYASAATSREKAEKALSLPVGVASPMWLAFGAAASVGVTWWWMTRWTRAVNLEAISVAKVEPAAPTAVAVAPVEIHTEPVVEEIAVEAEPMLSLEAEPEVEAKSRAATKAKPAPEPAPEPDDLTRLAGIGPKLALALAERGVTRFAHLAAWTAKDLAQADAALSLKGRAVRDAWVAQAKRMAAGA